MAAAAITLGLPPLLAHALAVLADQTESTTLLALSNASIDDRHLSRVVERQCIGKDY